jgi:preprotein translocase subunit SecD
MTTLQTLLRDADPLADEPGRTAEDRRRDRQRVLTFEHVARKRPRARRAMMAIAAVALAALVTGYWSVTAAVRFEVRLAEDNPANGLREILVSGSRRIYLQQRAVVTNSDIAQAEVVPGNTASTFNVSIRFTPDGAARMLRATQGHLGRPVAILLDGEVVMAPVVKSPISNAAMITGNYTRAEAERIVNGIIGR